MFMRLTLLVLAIWASYVACVHSFGGERRVVLPFRRDGASMDPFARGTMLVVWHVVTWVLVTLAAVTALAALAPRFVPIVALAGIQAAGFTVVFVLTARRELGAAIRLPQWLILGPLATGLLATLTDRPGAVAAGGLVGLIGLAHLAWVFGVTFPARDRAQLAAYVLPSRPGRPAAGRMPSRFATVVVAVVCFAMSASLVATFAPRAVVLAIAVVFALRGLAGLVYGAARRPGGPFFVYDRIVYSPGCLFIAGLAFSSIGT